MDNQKIGKFIFSCRKEKGFTQQALAKKLYVTDKAISKWERGLSLPDISSLEPLANILGVSVAELLKGERLEIIGKETVDQLITDTTKEFVDKANKKSMIITTLLCIVIIVVATLSVLFLSYKNAQQDLVNIGQSLESVKDNTVYTYESVTDSNRNVLHELTADEHIYALDCAGNALALLEITDTAINKYTSLNENSEKLFKSLVNVYDILYEFGYNGDYYVPKDKASYEEAVNQLYSSYKELAEEYEQLGKTYLY